MTSSFDERIRRAKELGEQHPFAAEMLQLYADIANFQCSVYESLIKNNAAGLESLVGHFAGLQRVLERTANAQLAGVARALSPRVLQDYWHGEPVLESEQVFVARALLQPYAEYLTRTRKVAADHRSDALCPHCRRKPVAGVLRPEGDGARRLLLCSLCLSEWSYRRIVCPECGNQADDRLTVYVAEQFAHVRLEACEVCQTYIKTIDMTQAGRAVPVVDEIAAVPLDVWAQERGYRKLETNLLGL